MTTSTTIAALPVLPEGWTLTRGVNGRVLASDPKGTPLLERDTEEQALEALRVRPAFVLALAHEEYAERMPNADDDAELEEIAAEIAGRFALNWIFVDDTAEVRFNVPFSHIEAPVPGTLTSEISARFCRLEVSREEAPAAIRFFLANGAQQVEDISWVHSHNRPGCLPAVVANTSGLSYWTKGEDGAPVEKPVNIF